MKRRGESKNLENQERTVPEHAELIAADDYDAVIMELDGVLTNTVELHWEAYKETFDTLLRTREGRNYIPFDRQEFREHVDGKVRRDAIESFLASRNITLPRGEALPAQDEAMAHDTDSVHGLEKMKQAAFDQRIESGQLQVRQSAVDLLHKLVKAGIKTGVVSSSHRTRRVLSIRDLTGLFDVIIDAQTYADEDLSGKPTSDIFNEAATQLGVTRDRTVIIENDRPGIEAGRGAGFGLIAVVAEDEDEHNNFLKRGADLAVADLEILRVRDNDGHQVRL